MNLQPRPAGAASVEPEATGAPAVYEIRVDGHLDDHWSDRLGGMAITRHEDGTSTLAGPVADQARLHGVLAGIRDIGATLLELRSGGRPAPSRTPNSPPAHVGGRSGLPRTRPL